jgi:chromate transport protein ChrA
MVKGALRALAPAVIGMLAAATFSLARAGIDGWVGGVIAVVTFAALARFAVSPLWALVGGGLAQICATLLGHRG